MGNGMPIRGSARIPIGEMAKASLGEIFPHLTREQVEAIRAGRPVPPSPDYRGPEEKKEEEAGGQVGGASLLPAPLSAFPFPLVDPHAGKESVVPPSGLGEDLPLVTCILVFGLRERIRMARKAVQQFVEQVYPRKQLVIVNTTDLDVTTVPHFAIKERRVSLPRRLTLGQMRNIGLELADGDWVRPCWDDDDYYHPLQLAYQMCFRRPGHASLLTHQMRVDINTATAYVHHQEEGIPNTMLVPRSSQARFPDVDVNDAQAFWLENYGDRTVAVDNGQFPFNGLSVAAYHGHNVTPREEFMYGHSEEEYHGRWELDEQEAMHLRVLLAGFGIEARPRTSDEVVAGTAGQLLS
jgi:hypothetical protein